MFWTSYLIYLGYIFMALFAEGVTDKVVALITDEIKNHHWTSLN